MSYGKIYSTYWTDEKILSVSDSAKLLGCYLLSSPHRNSIGCFRLPTQYMAADLGWNVQKIGQCIAELEAVCFIVRDEASGWTLIKNLMKYDPPFGNKSALGALRVARTVPRNIQVYSELYNQLAPILEAQLQGYPDRLESPIEGASMDHAMPHRSPNPSPSPIPEPNPYPSKRASRAPLADARFESFWEACVLKKGKGGAERAFSKAIRKPGVTVECLIERIKAYYAEPRDDIRFAKHPATWLNQECWLDEIAPVAMTDAQRLAAEYRARSAANQANGGKIGH